MLLAVLAWGCGGEGPPGAAELQLGTIDLRHNGDSRWVDIRDGQDAELAPGAQGGFHIWLRYRVRHLAGAVVVKRIADRVVGDERKRVLTTQGVQAIPAQDPWEPMDPIPNFMCPTPVDVSVIDQPIELLMSIEEMGGRPLVEQRVRLVARCPPARDPEHPFCLKICSG